MHVVKTPLLHSQKSLKLVGKVESWFETDKTPGTSMVAKKKLRQDMKHVVATSARSFVEMGWSLPERNWLPSKTCLVF